MASAPTDEVIHRVRRLLRKEPAEFGGEPRGSCAMIRAPAPLGGWFAPNE